MKEFIVHFPVLAVMVLFLGAFLAEIFGFRSRIARRVILVSCVSVSAAMIFALIPAVFLRGEVLTYWMGAWEPAAGYAIGIGYEIDALGLFFALLVVTTFCLSAVYSLRYMERDRHLGHYTTLFLMLCGSVLGLVLTGDIFNLFVMVEIMTFAAVALTAFRGSSHGALEAAFKYLVIGSIGSGMTLSGIALLYLQCHTLNMAQLSAVLSGGLTPASVFALGLMTAGFGVKAFLVPFHTPAADAYTAAPSSVSMVFSGMVNKAGVYGLIRLVYTVFRAMDRESLQITLIVLGTVTMFAGVTMALAQHDFKRLLAFHSISQIGYVITAVSLGTVLGVSGGLFHAMNHTLFKGLLFLCAGAVYYAAGTTDLDRLGGLSKKMPHTTAFFLIGAFSIAGLPPFNGFASKWFIYQAAWSRAVSTGNFFYTVVTVTAVIVSVMTLASFIKVTQAVFFGQLPAQLSQVREVPLTMRIPMAVLSLGCLAGGLFYPFVSETLLAPAAKAVFTPSVYIDAMMGAGTAQAAGVTDAAAAALAVPGTWDPVLWLILLVIVLLAFFLVILTGEKTRGAVLDDGGQEDDGRYATFFGGERALPSHVSGSDLFWGFRKNWDGYFRIAQGLHSGRVNDYASYAVIGAAVLIIVIFLIFGFR